MIYHDLARAALILAVSTGSSLSQPCFGADDARAELVSAEIALAAAVLSLNFEILENAYADDFVFTHSTGLAQTKEEWLTALRAVGRPSLSRTVDSIEVELHGDVAVTNGRIHSKTNSANPRWREYTVWYVRVYRRQDNRWQLLSHRTIREQTGSLAD